ncbi:MAG: hypothetical protein PHQ27_09960 [Victivallales bacterium]|nr:hypothetical protein [Victivallales bacterium]
MLEHDVGIRIFFYDGGVAWKLPPRPAAGGDEFMGKLMSESGRGLDIIRAMAADMVQTRYGDINETVITIGGDQ